MWTLLTSRRFLPLFCTQFLSSFNDNFLKNAIVFFVLYKIATENSGAYVTLASAIFIAPSVIFSGIGGELADRFDKARITRYLRLFEIGITSTAVAGYELQSLPLMFAALFLFGVISALFGPIKYGILPDHLATEEIPTGNALVEGATFIAILLGGIAGGLSTQINMPEIFGVLMVVLALACWYASRFIPATREAAPDLKIDANIARSTFRLLAALKSDKRLWHTGIMVSLFWLIAALITVLTPTLITVNMGGDKLVVVAFFCLFAVFIAVGSGVGAFLSTGRVVLLPVPVACLIIGLVALDLGFAIPSFTKPDHVLKIGEFFQTGQAWHLTIDLVAMAILGGIFIVPAFSATQVWAPNHIRARIVGAVNVLSAAFMLVSELGVGALQGQGITIGQLFMAIGIFALACAVWIFKVMPTSPMRDLLSIMFRAIYRVKVTGLENIAKAGPNAIIALNHISYLDPALTLSVLENDPVFAIDHGMSRRWWVKPFLRFARAFPLDPTRPLAVRALIKSIREDGETLVIFPEGRLTVTGGLMKVYNGAGLIAEKSGVKVVPVRIDGIEYTYFTRLKSHQVRRRLFPKVRVSVLEPVTLKVDDALKGKARREAAGEALYQIMSDLMFRTTPTNRTIFEAAVEAATIHGEKRLALEDPVTGKLTYKRMLISARVLGKKLMALADEQKAVGVMLPNSNGAALTVLGLMSANRVPAMLNFTSGAANIKAACKAAEISTIVTSRVFVEKARLGKLIEAVGFEVKVIYLEDVRATVTALDKLAAAMHYRKPLAQGKSTDRAAILFTSGSEGTPKGVVLSHANMLANVAQAGARIDFGREDKVFNVLPMFHAFGLTIGFVLPLVSGVPIYLYPSPLHYRIVPELVYGSNATVLFGTDTFLTGYARMAHPYDFRSLRLVMAGAEPVKDTTRQVYMEKFGLRILEGYGLTETAPVIAINTPMYNRSGTVGRIMPGIDTRLQKVEGIDEGGRLHVRGPNVMLGYLKADAPGILEPVQDGWYDTGDIVSIDEQGFVRIKGRAKRFAKIGGEMISLAAVEQLAAACWPNALSAVVAQADARKGERLVLVTEEKTANRAGLQAYAKVHGASDLMIPADVLVMESLPLLGSGKLDYPAIGRLAQERCTLSEV